MLLGNIAGSNQVLKDYFAAEDFQSHFMIENMLALMRRFGFLHFCSEEIFTLSENIGSQVFFRRNFDEFMHKWDNNRRSYWWRGYNPVSENYAQTYENLFDALLIYQNDARFYEHVNCFSALFNVSANIIKNDFKTLKILKENDERGLKALKTKYSELLFCQGHLLCNIKIVRNSPSVKNLAMRIAVCLISYNGYNFIL